MVKNQVTLLPQPNDLNVNADLVATALDDPQLRAPESVGMHRKRPGYTAGTKVVGFAVDDNKENSAPKSRTRKDSGFKKPAQMKRKAPTCFLGLPLAPLFHILSLLEHKDLLNLTRVSKTLRRTLIDSKSTASNRLWREKRHESGASTPPPGYTEAKWVSSLFMSECYDLEVERQNQILKRKQDFVAVLRQRFRAMGIYNPRDIDTAVTVDAVEPRPDIDDTVLSDKDWDFHRAIFDCRIGNARRLRRMAEYKRRLKELARRWESRIPSSQVPVGDGTVEQRRPYPTAIQLQEKPDVAKVLVMDLDRSMTQVEWESLVDTLLEICGNLVTQGSVDGKSE